MLEYIFHGFLTCCEPFNLCVLALAVILGIVVGALPGFGAATGLILVLPLTYSIEPGTAFIALTGIYIGAEYGGSISSILLNAPGTGGALVTCFDGFPMARSGKAREALFISNIASFSGGIISGLVMLLCMPALAEFVLQVGAGEIFVLAVIGLLLVGSLSGGDPIKGVASAALGVFMTCIGADSFLGNPRFDFGYMILYGGIPFIPVMLAVFSVPHLLRLVLAGAPKDNAIALGNVGTRENMRLFARIFCKMFASMKVLLVRSGLLGVLIGIVPGVGGSVATMVAYFSAKRSSKHPERFGKGVPEGIAAPEASNNGLVGGSLIPVLALGIPGSPAAAIFMGAIFLHGMTPGPNFLANQGALVYLLIVAVFMAALIQLLLGLFTIGSFAKILKVPPYLLFPTILVICSIGAYVVRGLDFDIWLFAIFGVIAFFLLRIGFNSGAFILGMILGSITERSLLESMTIAFAKGTLWEYFLSRRIAVGMVCALILYMGYRIYAYVKNRSKMPAKEQKETLSENVAAASGKWTAPRIWDVAFAALLLGVCFLLYLQLDDLPEKTALFPRLVLQVIMISMGCLLVKAIFAARLYVSANAPVFGNLPWKKLIFIMAVWLGYLLLIPLLGFYTSSFLLVLILAGGFGGDKWRNPMRAAVGFFTFSLIFSFCSYLIFNLLFNINTPAGILI